MVELQIFDPAFSCRKQRVGPMVPLSLARSCTELDVKHARGRQNLCPKRLLFRTEKNEDGAFGSQGPRSPRHCMVCRCGGPPPGSRTFIRAQTNGQLTAGARCHGNARLDSANAFGYNYDSSSTRVRHDF